MDSAVRALVWQRAGSCCEYCRLAQRDTPFRTFHIDHIVPRKHGGLTILTTLLWRATDAAFTKARTWPALMTKLE